MPILDTNVILEILRPAPDAGLLCWFAGQDDGTIFLTDITEAELRRGIALMPAGRRRDTVKQAVASILREDFRDRILPFDSAAAAAYAAIAAGRQAIGRPISHADAHIAAIAAAWGMPLATRNVRDFDLCGVEIIDPWRIPG